MESGEVGRGGSDRPGGAREARGGAHTLLLAKGDPPLCCEPGQKMGRRSKGVGPRLQGAWEEGRLRS